MICFNQVQIRVSKILNFLGSNKTKKVASYLPSMPLILNFLKRALLFLLMACIVLNTTIVYALPISQGSDNIIPQCGEIKESKLWQELNSVIQEFLSDEAKVDFSSIVNREWNTLKLDSVIDSAIDKAVNDVNSDAGFINRFASSWIPSKAEELANQVTEVAFNSPILKTKLIKLSHNIAIQISNQLEAAVANTSFYALSCIQQFLNDKYSQSIVNSFSEKIGSPDIKITDLKTKPNTKHGGVWKGGSIFVSSLIVQINKKTVSAIVNRILPQLGERVLGRIGSGFIPVVGEVIGGIWLASDIVKSFDGILPEIQKILKASDVKENIRQQIASTAEEQIRNEYPQIAGEISNNIYAVWLDFYNDYTDTLKLARELPEFRDILAKSNQLNFTKISSLVGISLNYMGRSRLVQDIQNGKFERVLALPEVSYKIIETTHSLSTLVDWANLAGDKLENVVRLELYKHLSPKDLNYKSLKDILDIGDDTTISKLSLLNIDSIQNLLKISKQNLVSLGIILSINDLENLAGYVANLKQFEINQIVKFLLSNASLIQNSDIMVHIIQSQKITNAIEFWKTKNAILSIADGIFKALTGSISWYLVGDKFGITLILGLIGIPIIILLVFVWFLVRWFISRKKQQELGE
ncbi:hypothetical protein IQ231_17625 [Cuspidothrix issatschenkoi LEGE 03284]|uniref:hypothetical protein n=1 Tax=Cuspidothrix issatschenkoi TaxID=230752 RepID=UPI0018809B91|nr:hypothetical protein [Cuspidothrix issatschenkoi]MBE9233439.1 hypothetical protein [Cuspidothrix issatschenkoi LEGE 03284]